MKYEKEAILHRCAMATAITTTTAHGVYKCTTVISMEQKRKSYFSSETYLQLLKSGRIYCCCVGATAAVCVCVLFYTFVSSFIFQYTTSTRINAMLRML